MKKILRAASVLIASIALSGCVVTAPIKVATTGAKVGYKTAKVGAKGAVKAGSLIIPGGGEAEEPEPETEAPPTRRRR